MTLETLSIENEKIVSDMAVLPIDLTDQKKVKRCFTPLASQFSIFQITTSVSMMLTNAIQLLIVTTHSARTSVPVPKVI